MPSFWGLQTQMHIKPRQGPLTIKVATQDARKLWGLGLGTTHALPETSAAWVSLLLQAKMRTRVTNIFPPREANVMDIHGTVVNL